MIALSANANPAPIERKALLVDDRGIAITVPVEVCAVVGTARSCHTHGGSEPFALPAFDLLTFEGPEHGPASFHPSDLKPQDVTRLTVPRKALLRVTGSPAGSRLTASLYRTADPDFRRPAFRAPIAPDLRIPSGDFLLSLARNGAAPDLQLIEAHPGVRVAATYRARSGWSLLARIVSSQDHKPIAGAAVAIRAAEGYGDADPSRPTARAASSGLAILAGLRSALATATVSRDGYVAQQVPGLTASPGTFAFREVSLERPGSARVAVRVDGKPAARASCRITAPAASASSQSHWVAPKVYFEGSTDGTGVCHAAAVPAGSYALRLSPAGARGSAHVESVTVESGRETKLEEELLSIPLSGSVTRGQEPAPGLKIVVAAANPHNALETAAEAVTDDKGEYQTTLWSTGEYFVHLKSATGWLADMKRISVGRTGETCDFHLSPADLLGRINDPHGNPVTGATVSLRWNEHRIINGKAGPDGTFALSLPEGGGEAELRAFHPDYRPGEPVSVAVPADGSPPFTTLVLTKEDGLSGAVVSAAGNPVAGAWVAAYPEVVAENVLQVGAVATDAAGHFTIPGARAEPLRLFVTGPGCPLRSLDVPASAPSPGAGPTLVIPCGPAPANLALRVVDSAGRPVANEGVLLRQGAIAIPPEVLAAHLALLGLATTTDGSGRLVLAGLQPGDYGVFLEGAANPVTMSSDLPNGKLVAASLAPLQTAEIEVTVDRTP